MEILLVILAMIALLLFQGFFSGSEIALVHADRLKLHHQANKGNRGADKVLQLLHKPEVLLGTTLVGTNISVVALTTLGTILMINLFGEHGDMYSLLIYTPLFLIFGEVVPKSIYQQKADVLAPLIIYPLQAFLWLFYPVVFVFSWIARRVAHLAGADMSTRELFVNREQIRSVIEMAERGANIDVFDRDRILRVMRYADVTVGQAMVPINEMSTLNHLQTTSYAINMARQRAHFRLPVYEGDHYKIIGIVSFTMWNLMDRDLAEKPLSELIKPALFVTAHQLLDELLPVLQQRHDHMAIVVDEFGSAIGMITLEDILNEVVGEVINVGYKFDSQMARRKHKIDRQEDGSYMIDGRTPISDVSDTLGISLPYAEAHTIGGLVISHLQHIPAQGESVTFAGISFTAVDVNDRGIEKLQVEISGE